jgi:hypothetical protein
MARGVLAETPHHVTQRGVDRQAAFFSDAESSRLPGIGPAQRATVPHACGCASTLTLAGQRARRRSSRGLSRRYAAAWNRRREGVHGNHLEALRKESQRLDNQRESAQAELDRLVQELSFDVNL